MASSERAGYEQPVSWSGLNDPLIQLGSTEYVRALLAYQQA
ncbi:MAG TPA: hypothetical protein VGC66_01470 [Pyrinomonadaceae bacterium]